MKAKAPKGLYRKFAKYIKDNTIQAYVVAEQSEISQTQLSFILKGERPLTEENRKRLNNTLKTDF